MKGPRGLSGEEAALWARVAATVKPLGGRNLSSRALPQSLASAEAQSAAPSRPAQSKPKAVKLPLASPLPQHGRAAVVPTRHGLDATWDGKLSRGIVSPDFTIDLHGLGLDAAWSRLEHGLHLAASQGARVVLVVTGRPRPVDRGAGGGQRGVIRAKLLDWLASGSHAAKIAAVRNAHPRHGGAGAVYLVLRKSIP